MSKPSAPKKLPQTRSVRKLRSGDWITLRSLQLSFIVQAVNGDDGDRIHLTLAPRNCPNCANNACDCNRELVSQFSHPTLTVTLSQERRCDYFGNLPEMEQLQAELASLLDDVPADGDSNPEAVTDSAAEPEGNVTPASNSHNYGIN